MAAPIKLCFVRLFSFVKIVVVNMEFKFVAAYVCDKQKVLEKVVEM